MILYVNAYRVKFIESWNTDILAFHSLTGMHNLKKTTKNTNYILITFLMCQQNTASNKKHSIFLFREDSKPTFMSSTY